MRHADRPSGPGKPLRERQDAVTAAEESDELAAAMSLLAIVRRDRSFSREDADRNAHANRDKGAGDNASGGS